MDKQTKMIAGLGAVLADMLQGHWHGAGYFTSGGANSGAGPYIVGTATATGRTANTGEISISAATTDGTNGTPITGPETEPNSTTVYRAMWAQTLL